MQNAKKPPNKRLVGKGRVPERETNENVVLHLKRRSASSSPKNRRNIEDQKKRSVIIRAFNLKENEELTAYFPKRAYPSYITFSGPCKIEVVKKNDKE